MEATLSPKTVMPNVILEIDAGTTVNYAMHQNDVAVVRRLRLQNNEEYDVDNVTVSIESEPEFAHIWKTRVERLPAQSTHDFGVVDLPLSPKFLGAQTEATRGYLTVRVCKDDEPIAEERITIDVLAYDEWNGLRTLPELLAAFIMPNHPMVERILRQAAGILRSWVGSSSLTGYQTRDPEQVKLQAAAIYEAIKRQDIAYTGVPASFEETGQKVRTPERIVEQKLGNCLDLSVLFAAALEQVGLHPLICIIEGHAFPGVWLHEDGFADPAVDDPSAITKRVALGEISIFESTFVTQSDADFGAAQVEARRHLDNPDVFVCAIDVARARSSHIRPIPMRGSVEGDLVEGTSELAATAHRTKESTSTPFVGAVAPSERLASPNVTNNASPSGPVDRLDRWKRKLLDLSLRNTLLNFRETKRTVPLLSTNLADVENVLAEGRQLAIHPAPADWEKTDRDPSLFRERTGEQAVADLLRSEFEKGRLRAALGETELQRRLIEIYRSARSSLEENGANTLYLSLGCLAWYETNSPNAVKRLSPLLLIPIEIRRKSVQAPFTIELRDEDAQFNVTLLEMLRADFDLEIPGLDPLPQDEAGVDVDLVLRIVREAIKHIPRWDVEEQAYVGLFSFTKFLMWRDLESRTEDLKRNKLVASLIDFPHRPLPVSSELPDADTLDEKYDPSDLFCPLDADSSQIAAVLAAAEGNTFVLHGPPGTGKSQTIANMIAHALGQGKTVLFVAEKIAALSVVQRRLAQNGLGEFCLELHSNKSKKADVIRQLGDTLQLVQTQEPEQWAEEAARLARLRNELNAYVEALHRRRKSGDSFYLGLSRLIQHREAPRVRFERTMVDDATSDTLASWREQTQALVRTGKAVGHPSGHVWSGAEVAEWSPDLRDDVQSVLDRALAVIPQLIEATRPVAELFGSSTEAWSRDEFDVLYELAKLILGRMQLAPALVSVTDWDDTKSAVEAWIRKGKERDELRARLYDRFTENLLQLDLERLALEWEAASQKWVLPRWLSQRRILKQLQSVAKPGSQVSAVGTDEILSLANRLKVLEGTLTAASERARDLLGRLWADGEADWGSVQTALDVAEGLRTLAAALGGSDLAFVRQTRERWAMVLAEATEAFGEQGTHAKSLCNFYELGTDLKEQLARLSALLSMSEQSPLAADGSDDYLNWLQAILRRWSDRTSDLRHWCTWQAERARAIAAGLGPLVAEYEAGLSHDQVMSAFERSFYESWVDVIMGEDHILRDFSRHSHEDKIREFRELDERFKELTKQVLRARLSAQVPQPTGAPSHNSELGILRREVQKQTRHMPIRALFNRIPNLLTRLKPCLLMSPISVAQYLDAGFPPFDLVIFDEASQIPTWDAVGAIARGTEAIIVGDPKQLPPTSFFSRADSGLDDDSADEVVEDLESILDDCLSLTINELRLRWHYRSRNEALIAFSNAEYYKNELLTFPSPETERAVRLRYVQGVYDRSRSRTNRIEAEAVVQEVVRRLADPDLSRLTIGVVTFSQAQQRLIEDLLEEACRRQPELEAFFDPDLLEPVFVKNLENVQGDERDVILFSIGYGPDSVGRMSMNFGPLNRDGGERRLNVAITRARHAVEVFASFLPDQIDLARTQKRGVQDLKTFLEYAQRGPVALERSVLVSGNEETESPLEQDVMEALRDRGHQVLAQVGCSGYRIDLAVVDPDNPGRFVLGIECDGAMYHSSKNARDREKLREAVLRDLGWEIHRIWSLHWWQDRDGELERLEAAIEAAKTRTTSEPDRLGDSVAPSREWKIASAPLSSMAVPHPAPVPAQPATLPQYVPSSARPDAQSVQMDFYSPGVNSSMRTLIEQIVDDEGPISLNLLARRVAPHWGISRVTSRAQARVFEVLKTADVQIIVRNDITFVWPKGTAPALYETFRIPRDADSRRDAEDLPPEEVANAVLHILRTQVSLPREDLVREAARLLGYQRTGPVVVQSISAGIELLEVKGAIRETNGMIVEVSR